MEGKGEKDRRENEKSQQQREKNLLKRIDSIGLPQSHRL